VSLETWKAEFYPVEASATRIEDATAHSLRKWVGLRKENLERHGVFYSSDTRRVTDQPVDLFSSYGLVVSNESCALCHHHNKDRAEQPCGDCPLAISRDGVPCDESDRDESSVWILWGASLSTQNPEPMIAALEAALEMRQA